MSLLIEVAGIAALLNHSRVLKVKPQKSGVNHLADDLKK